LTIYCCGILLQPMESKAALKERLINEGRWEAFKTRREELKASGTDPKQAWEIARREFEPQENPATYPQSSGNNPCAADSVNVAAAKPKPKTKHGSITKDFEWVYWNIGDLTVAPDNAPSLSAWWMLERIRSNPSAQLEFIRTLLQRLRPDKNDMDSERFNDDGRQQLSLIERVRTASQNSLLPSGA
jgi:hypothetical protein